MVRPKLTEVASLPPARLSGEESIPFPTLQAFGLEHLIDWGIVLYLYIVVHFIIQ